MDVYNFEESANLASYIESDEWELIGIPAERVVRHYDGPAFGPNGMDFVEIWYYLQVARTRASGLTNYVIPGILICILVLNVFLLPPDSGEKISLAITTFLTLMVANQLVADNTPTARERPIIVSFFTHSIEWWFVTAVE